MKRKFDRCRYILLLVIGFLGLCLPEKARFSRGGGTIPSHLLRLGDRELRVSYLICYDSNFPLYVNRRDRGSISPAALQLVQ